LLNVKVSTVLIHGANELCVTDNAGTVDAAIVTLGEVKVVMSTPNASYKPRLTVLGPIIALAGTVILSEALIVVVVQVATLVAVSIMGSVNAVVEGKVTLQELVFAGILVSVKVIELPLHIGLGVGILTLAVRVVIGDNVNDELTEANDTLVLE
jgi:hypothetical protein